MYHFKQIINGKIASVESKSINIASPGFIPALEAEYTGYLTSLGSDKKVGFLNKIKGLFNGL